MLGIHLHYRQGLTKNEQPAQVLELWKFSKALELEQVVQQYFLCTGCSFGCALGCDAGGREFETPTGPTLRVFK